MRKKKGEKNKILYIIYGKRDISSTVLQAEKKLRSQMSFTRRELVTPQYCKAISRAWDGRFAEFPNGG